MVVSRLERDTHLHTPDLEFHYERKLAAVSARRATSNKVQGVRDEGGGGMDVTPTFVYARSSDPIGGTSMLLLSIKIGASFEESTLDLLG